MLAVQNFLVIVVEIGLLVLIFSMINWLVGKILKQLTKAVSSKKMKITIQNIQGHTRTILTLSGGFICLLIVGINSRLVYKGENLLSR